MISTPHGHGALQVDQETAEAVWAVDNVELTTVGIDIGSATSHLMFSQLHLRRRTKSYSSRFEIVSRQVLARSPVMLTPYETDGTIATAELAKFIGEAYRSAGIERDDVDTGAVILTGVAIERVNARRIADLFAVEGGKFVCASAGHGMEATLAAHGSGSVARSKKTGVVLNVDVGGGTTKLALCVDGKVEATMAFWGGARLITFDGDRITRIEPAMARLLDKLRLGFQVGSTITSADRERIANSIAERIISAVQGRVDASELLEGGIPPRPRPDLMVFSGGVASLLNDRNLDEQQAQRWSPSDDLGQEVAQALDALAHTVSAPHISSDEPIWATVVGASQFTVQLSGNTVHLSGSLDLPVHNIPVAAVDIQNLGNLTPRTVADAIVARSRVLGLSKGPAAVALNWNGEPYYRQLWSLAEGLVASHHRCMRGEQPLIVILEADVGASLGSILIHELDFSGGVIAIDALAVGELDYIDIGEPIRPANVVPVVVKSLILRSPMLADTEMRSKTDVS